MKKTLIAVAVCVVIAACATKVKPPYISTEPIQAATTRAAAEVTTQATSAENHTKVIRSEAVAAQTAPTTEAVQPHLSTIIANADSIFGVIADMRGTAKRLGDLSAAFQVLQSQYDQQAKELATAKADLVDKDAEVAKWKSKYDNQWLAGKSWRLIYWIVGIVTGLIVLDVVLYFALGVGINPLSLAVRLFGRLFQGKTFGGAPIRSKPQARSSLFAAAMGAPISCDIPKQPRIQQRPQALAADFSDDPTMIPLD